MRSIHFTLAGLVLAASAGAQQFTLGPPALGYVFDAGSRVIRPILGVPGAAVLGPALEFGHPIAAAAISPSNDFALTISRDGDLRIVFLGDAAMAPAASQTPCRTCPRLPRSTPAHSPERPALPWPRRILFSPAGRAAAVCWASAARLQVLSGLPHALAAREIDLASLGLDAAVLAVSDAGDLILAPANRETNAAWLLRSDGGPVQLYLTAPVAAAAFRSDSREAVAVTRSGDVFRIPDAGASLGYRQAYAGDDQTAAPVAVAYAPDRSQAYIANATGLAIVDLTAGVAQATPCGDCAPTGLDRMGAQALFRLNEVSDRPLWLFDPSGTEPRVWFVPADSGARPDARNAQ